jgi:probable O-glycosylation ligase (exosortase A-associated)
MVIPLMVYLIQTARTATVRWLIYFCALTTGAAILGSQSRGALVALTAMVLVLGLKGKRPLLSTAVLTCLLAGAIAFMPANWTSRMETIETYEHDGSAMSRLYTWKTLWALAIDRPITGGGFAIETDAIYSRYAPPIENPTPGMAQAPHSIYFQALGEHGFPGLALYLLLGTLTWRTAGRLARDTKEDDEFGPWVPALMKSVQISLVGFAVGGAFLTLLHFDLSYYLVAFVALADATIRERFRINAVANQPVIQTPVKGARQ